MAKLLKRILVGIFILTVLVAVYFNRVEKIPFQEAMMISLMLLSAGETLSLDVNTLHWFSDVLVVFQTLMGLATLSILLALLTNFLFSEKIQQLLQKEKITMKDHVILCGLGNVGFRVLEELEKMKQPVIIIDRGEDKNLVDQARKRGFKIIQENLKDEQTLDMANIQEAKSIIICTGDDLINMEIALNARERRSDIHIILRMFDQKLANKISHAFNIKLAFSSSQLSAPVFAAASIDRSVSGAIRMGNDTIISAEKEVRPGSKLDGMTLGEWKEKRMVSVLKVISGGQEIKFPPPSYRMKAKDIIYITCPQEELLNIKQDNQAG